MSKADDDTLEEAREAFKLAFEAEQENREAAIDDLRFAVEEDQWPAEVRRQREIDGRPCLTRNLMGPFIRQVVNDARQNRPQMKVQPADDQADSHTAQMIGGLLRSIENNSCADVAYDTSIEFAVSSGLGYIRVGTDYACDDTFDMDVNIETVDDPFTVFGDPYGRSFDGSDWMSAFEVQKVPIERFRTLYKGAEEVDWDELGYRPDDHWVEGAGVDRQIMLANWWRRERVQRKILLLDNGAVVGEDVFKENKDAFTALGVQVHAEREIPSYAVNVTKLTGAEVLEPEKPWAGRFIPLVPVYGHVININGKRRISSLIRSAKDAQRSYNFHHTTAAELTGYAPKAPFIGPKGAFRTDRNKWETANTVSWPYIEYDLVPGMGAPPQRQPFAGVPAGEMAAAQSAQADMRAIIGMFEASLGQRSNETSGRAIVARQREGDTATFHYIDNLNRAIRQVAKIVLDLVPSVYTPDRVVRVLGQDGSTRPIPLGQPTPRMKLGGQPGEVDRAPDGSPVMHVYDVTAGKYDVVLSSGPGYTTKREEAATQMIELIRAYPMAAPVIGDLLAKNLDWPGADEIAQRLYAMMPEQAKGGDGPETAQLKQNLQSAQNELQALKRNIETMQTDRALKAKEVEIDEKKLEIQAYEAESRRMAMLVGKNGVGLSKDDVAQTVLATINQLLNDPDLLEKPPMAVPPVQGPAPPPQAPPGEPDADEGPQGQEPPGPEEPPQPPAPGGPDVGPQAQGPQGPA